MTETIQLIEPIMDSAQRESEFFTFKPIDISDMTVGEPLARSGESVVYTGVQEHIGEIAIKVGCRLLVDTCVEAVQEPYASLPTHEALEMVEQQFHNDRVTFLARTRERLDELEHYFGESVMAEKWSLQQVPFPGSLLAYCLRSQLPQAAYVPSLDSDDTYLLETFVRTQPLIPDLQDPDRSNLSTRYAEKVKWDNLGFITEEEYKAATRELVFQDGYSLKTNVNMEDLLRIQGSPYLGSLVARLEIDPELTRSLCIFLESLAEYVDATGGVIVDTIGKDNIIFNPACIMPDGLYTDDVQLFKGAANAMEVIAEGECPPREKMNQLFNTLNFTRGINIIALACKSKVRFSLTPPEAAELEDVLNEIIVLSRSQYGLQGEPRIVE